MSFWSPERKVLFAGTLAVCAALGLGWVVSEPSFLLGFASFWAIIVLVCQVFVVFDTCRQMRAFLGSEGPNQVFAEWFPCFRYVDLYRALKAFASETRAHHWMEAHFPQQQGLSELLQKGAQVKDHYPQRQRLPVDHDAY